MLSRVRIVIFCIQSLADSMIVEMSPKSGSIQYNYMLLSYLLFS